MLLVLGRHAVTYPLALGKNVTFYVSRFWQNGGWTGVDLFFVLSGYLIGGLLLEEIRRSGGLRVGRFLLRRGWKIYPAFYVFLAVGIAVRLLRHDPIRPRSLLAEVFFLQNYLGGMWNHTWSLAIEEHFYLLLPLLLLALLRSRAGLRLLPPLVAAVMAVCLTWRIVLARTIPFDNLTHLFPTHLRIDSLLAGVCIAYLAHFHRARLLAWRARWQPLLLVAAPLLFLPAFRFPLGSHWWLHSVALTGFALGGAAAVILIIDREPPPGRLTRAASFLGATSYSVYLWHVPVEQLCAWLWRMDAPDVSAAAWYGYFVTYAVGAFAAGIVMSKAVELPLLALRNRIAPPAVSASEAVRPAPAP